MTAEPLKPSGGGTSDYSLNDAGDFVISDYNSQRPFSSFLPGIAGVDGIPLWVFYVNRGQCICSVGVRDKDHAIMEFHPANRAYDLVTTQGFRTFLKLSEGPQVEYYEPFQKHFRNRSLDIKQRMIVSPAHLTLEELNHSLNLSFTVNYFPVPQDVYGGLVRTLTIQNTGSTAVSFNVLDGLPVVVPYGVDNHCLKNMRRTIEAFVEVCNLDQNAPFFRAKVEAADRPDVRPIKRGNFYIGFLVTESGRDLVNPLVDPARIFGERTDFSFPEGFLKKPLDELIENQICESKLPCAMGSFSVSLEAGQSVTYTSIIGHVSSISALNKMLPRIATGPYIEEKARTNRDVIARVSQNGLLCSNEPRLDLYARQNALDNVLRGGLPITLTGTDTGTTFHVYARKHGDLERDYNDFCVMPTPYSQGNGNFRDINQNRRSDLLLNPDVGSENVEYFYNLIQLDGFNPLIVKEVHFEMVDRKKIDAVLSNFLSPDEARSAAQIFEEPFTPGSLLSFLNEQRGTPVEDSAAFLAELLSHCRKVPVTDHGGGFWIDHWTYNLDLLENYCAVFPDRLEALLFDPNRFSYYDSAYRVQRRDHKYVLWQGRPVQLDAVTIDDAKAAMIAERKSESNLARVNHGRGEVYRTSLFAKMLCVIVNKIASLDPEGIGVEMEAGKPGWYDALNGLPGLFGSSVCETLEIKRHIQFLAAQLNQVAGDRDDIRLFKELKEFMDTLHNLLQEKTPSFRFWDAAATAREEYRDKTRFGVEGAEVAVTTDWLQSIFDSALTKLEQGIDKAWDPESQTLFTYFRYDVADYAVVETSDSGGRQTSKQSGAGPVCIRPLAFRKQPLPLFLEGPVHYLRSLPDQADARRLAANVKCSGLYDAPLGMYKVNASLADEPMEIGRAKVFSSGWLENESIWLHMEYKYMLELLRNGLYEEFYADFRHVFVPFLDPAMYGRSTLENCSFLVSSAHPDTSIHGGGFVARLSGATAEFIHILSLMSHGPRPFQLDDAGTLRLCFAPALPAWLFTRTERTIELRKNNRIETIQVAPRTFSFLFLGKVLVCYHNSELKNTYGDNGVCPAMWRITHLNGGVTSHSGRNLEGDLAALIRERKLDRIDVELT